MSATIASSPAAALETSILALVVRSQTLRQAEQEDAVWDEYHDHAFALFAQVEALPNTREHLRLRALAIGASVDDTTDLATLDLGELSAHAPCLSGRLVRQVLACLVEQEG